MRPGSVDLRPAPRAAFTLVELLLVLGLLVTVAALAGPALVGPWANGRLRDAAGTVRNAAARARLAALRSGAPHGVWVELEGSALRIAPLADSSDETPAVGEFRGTSSGAAPASAGDPLERRPARHRLRETVRLPDGVQFAPGDQQWWAADRRLAAPLTEAGAEPSTGADAPPPGELALIWQPDGAAPGDAHLRVRDGRGKSLVVHIRGLTGGMSLGGVETPEELAP